MPTESSTGPECVDHMIENPPYQPRQVYKVLGVLHKNTDHKVPYIDDGVPLGDVQTPEEVSGQLENMEQTWIADILELLTERAYASRRKNSDGEQAYGITYFGIALYKKTNELFELEEKLSERANGPVIELDEVKQELNRMLDVLSL